jgi:ABC-type phosphate transport system substrate-binding protein
MTDCVNPPSADRRALTVAAVLALGLLTLPTGAARAGELNLTETGSSLLYPLFNVWVAEYTRTHPGIHITTASTGSGAGIDAGRLRRRADRRLGRLHVGRAGQ